MNEQILENIGLSKSEIKVYISLLEMGPSTSGPIIQKSGLQSSVVHRVIKTLIEKGIVTFLKIGKNKEYQATDPDNLLNFIEEKKKKFIDILPELKAKQKSNKSNYSTEMFLGKRAIFSAILNLIKDANPGEEYCGFSLVEEHNDKEIIDFFNIFHRRRVEKKLNIRVLGNIDVKKIYDKNYTRELLKEANVRYTTFNFPQGIMLFRDNIIFINWNDDPSAVLITNKTMSSQFRKFFMELYDQEKDSY